MAWKCPSIPKRRLRKDWLDGTRMRMKSDTSRMASERTLPITVRATTRQHSPTLSRKILMWSILPTQLHTLSLIWDLTSVVSRLTPKDPNLSKSKSCVKLCQARIATCLRSHLAIIWKTFRRGKASCWLREFTREKLSAPGWWEVCWLS